MPAERNTEKYRMFIKVQFSWRKDCRNWILNQSNLDFVLCNENQLDVRFMFKLFRHKHLHVSDKFIAHHQEVFTVYTATGMYYKFNPL
jgi:hypothetical protein